MVRIYQYPKCGTCKKALKWLEAHGIDYEAIDLVESPPSRRRLAELVERSGLPVRKWFNTSGQSYRQGGFKDKLEQMSDARALDALAADGKLIKRPVLIAGERVLVGFDEGAYRGLAGRSSR